MPTLQDVIRNIWIRGKTDGVTQSTGELQGLSVAQETVGKSSLSMAGKLESLQKSLDAEYLATQKLAAIEKTLNAARAQGLITTERQNELLGLAKLRYTDAGEAAKLMSERVATAKEAVLGMVGVLGGGALFVGLAELPSKIRETVQSVAEIGETAKTIGTTTDALQELDYAAGQVGVSTDTMNAALTRYSKNLGQAATGQGELNKVLKANHVTVSGDLKTDFENYLNLLARTDNQEQKNYLTTVAFGKGAADLGRLTSIGGKGVDDLAQRADNLGVVLSETTVSAAEDLNREFVTMQAQLGTTFEEFMVTVAPALEASLWAITMAVRAVNTAIQLAHDYQEASKPLDQQSTAYLEQQITGLKQQLKYAQVSRPVEVPGALGNNPMAADRGNTRGAATAAELAPTQAELQAELDQAEAVVAHRAIQGGVSVTGGASGLGGPRTKTPSPPDPEGDAQKKAIDEVTKSLKLQTAALTETDRQAFIDQQLSRAKVTDGTKAAKTIEDEAGAYYDEKRAIDSANQAATFLAQSTESAFESVVDGSKSAVDAVIDLGKALADAVIQAELLGTGPLAGILGTAPTTSGGAGGLLGSLFSALIPHAAGGVYASPSLHAYANTVLTRPTVFAFASGAGVAGEAGPEAIMPLKRGSDGRLGVAAANQNGGSGPVQIEVIVSVNDDGKLVAIARQAGGQAAQIVVRQTVPGMIKAGAPVAVADAQRNGQMGHK